MKKFIGIVVLLALLASPALAQTSAPCDVKLTIDGYAKVTADGETTIALTGGDTENVGHIWGEVISNTTCTLTATIVEETSAVGDWTIFKLAIDTTGDGLVDFDVLPTTPFTTVTYGVTTTGVAKFAVMPQVKNVPFDEAPIVVATTQAVVTITVSAF